MVLFFSTIIQAQSQYKGKINMYDDKRRENWTMEEYYRKVLY